MPAYAAAIPRPPRTLTELEQATLLNVTAEHRDGFRDHCIFALALGTGLGGVPNTCVIRSSPDISSSDGERAVRVSGEAPRRGVDEILSQPGRSDGDPSTWLTPAE
jgi:hypothetical protein